MLRPLLVALLATMLVLPTAEAQVRGGSRTSVKKKSSAATSGADRTRNRPIRSRRVAKTRQRLVRGPIKAPGRTTAARQLKKFRNVVIDIRKSRAGNGDVAGGYLTALDMRSRLGYAGSITLLADELSLRILSLMVGKQVSPGDSITGIGEGSGTIHVRTPGTLPKTFPAADLYLTMARPSAARQHINSQGIDDAGKPITIGSSDRKLVNGKTVRVAQTVFGNSNVSHRARPSANMWIGKEKFEISPPGLARHESGIYIDPVARHLRNKSPREVRQFVKRSIANMSNANARQGLNQLMDGTHLRGADRGLVYGITDPSVHGQFSTYLDGLLAKPDRSHVLVTPSRFATDKIPERLRGKVSYLSLSKGQKLPAKARPGHVYIVEVPTLPHKAFVGLMADSKVPPVVSGDNSMAAGISLGKPFVLTRVDWNTRNIRNLRQRLRHNGSGGQSATLDALFGVPKVDGRLTHDLSGAQKLLDPKYRKLFASLESSLEPLTDRVIGGATSARQKPTYERAMKTRDAGMRVSLLVKAAPTDPRAARAVSKFLQRNPERALGLVVTGVMDARALRDQRVRKSFANVLRAHRTPYLRRLGEHLLSKPDQAIADISTEKVRLIFADPDSAAKK